MERILKNVLFMILWVIYFSFYYSWNYIMLEYFINQKLIHWDVFLAYFTAIIWFFTTIWFIALINRSLEYLFKKYFEDNEMIHIIIDILVRFLSVTKYIIAFYVFSFFAFLPDYIRVIANKMYSIVILLIFLYYLSKFVNKFFNEELIEKSKLKAISKNLLPFVNKIIVIFIWVVWAITIIWNLWYNISALVAWAWIWWLAIAFAAQKSIANVFWAITILINKPFKIWDYINITGVIWEVKDIWLSYLTIIDKMWHQVMIPNEAIISNNIENYSVRKNRRVDFNIWLVYTTTIKQMEKWIKIIEDILNSYVELKTVSEFRVNFEQFWDFSLNIIVTYYSLINSNYNKFLKQKEKINLEIKKQLTQANLEIAFPTQELIIKK